MAGAEASGPGAVEGVPGLSTNGASANGAGPSAEPKLRLGGMALRNGLLIHGPTSWAAAARAADGTIEVASGPKPDFGGNRFASVPLLRGPLRLAEGFAVVPLARLKVRSARLPMEDPRVIGAGIVSSVAERLLRRGADGKPSPLRDGASLVLGLLPAAVSLSGSDLAYYHAVEHKAIAGYEQDADPADVPKEHHRCGSNLIVPMMVFSAAGQLIVERLLERPGRIARGVSGLLGLSLSVEVFVRAEREPDSPLGRAVHAVGDAIQRLIATREPSAEQLEVGVAALEAVLAAERG